MKCIKVLLIIIFALSITACDKSRKPVDKMFFEMGTVVHISIEEKDADKTPQIVAFMKELTNTIKKNQADISESDAFEKIEVSKDFINIYKRTAIYNKMSSGAYDPTTITVASLYGFPDKMFHMPSDKEIETAKKSAGLDKIVFKDGAFSKLFDDTLIDVSANSKGYIVDETVKFMKKAGFENFIVNAGGDVYVSGLKYGETPYKIYIEEPEKENGIANIIKLTNKAVATSGNYERFFINDEGKRITHIFDGRTFTSSNNYKSVSVIADTTEMADGLATMYFLSSIEKIKNHCQSLNTPVFLITLDNRKIRLCGWEQYEE